MTRNLGRWIVSLAAIALPGASANAQTTAPAPTAYDGRWAVALVCEDVRDKGTLVKGYTFNFSAEVKDGKLSAQQGKVGEPASLTMVGTIAPDGNAELHAHGRTGSPDYAVGHVARSTPYSYRMRGQFTPTSGKASRIELRPCEATFFKQ